MYVLVDSGSELADTKRRADRLRWVHTAPPPPLSPTLLVFFTVCV